MTVCITVSCAIMMLLGWTFAHFNTMDWTEFPTCMNVSTQTLKNGHFKNETFLDD
jgi:hypothetical protein